LDYLLRERARTLSPSAPYLQPPELATLDVGAQLAALRQEADEQSLTTRRICLRNVSFTATHDALVAEIQRLVTSGGVTDCYLVERQGRRTGTVFVEFSNEAAADEALDKLDGAVILGRTLAADVALKREPTKGNARQSRASAVTKGRS
jgi:RNA recognition motif-containing protein